MTKAQRLQLAQELIDAAEAVELTPTATSAAERRLRRDAERQSLVDQIRTTITQL